MEYGKKLPASNGKTGVVGFCWGGARSFAYAAHQPNLNAAVVFYGEAPGSGDNTLEAKLANVKAPVLGMYAGNDARIGATVPATEAAMKKLGKSYEMHTFDGAGHGFMFAQAGANGANLKAAQESWPIVLKFFGEKHARSSSKFEARSSKFRSDRVILRTSELLASNFLLDRDSRGDHHDPLPHASRVLTVVCSGFVR